MPNIAVSDNVTVTESVTVRRGSPEVFDSVTVSEQVRLVKQLGVTARAIGGLAMYGGYHRTGARAALDASTTAGSSALALFDNQFHRLPTITAQSKRLAGTTTVEGNAGGPYAVRLYQRSTGILVRTTTSLADGSFSFTSLPDDTYQVVCVDAAGGTQYNDVLVALVTPVV